MTRVGIAAMINGLVAGGPPVGPSGIFSLGDADHLKSLVAAAGFVDVSVEEIAIIFRAENIDAHIERVSSLAVPLATILQHASVEQQAAVRGTATDLGLLCCGRVEN